jgi:uncharacterized protein (DUF1778 family)
MKPENHTSVSLEAILPGKVLPRLRRAAELEGRTLADFVVTAADEAACRTIERREVIRVSAKTHRLLSKALLDPPKPTARLKKAGKRYRETYGIG